MKRKELITIFEGEVTHFEGTRNTQWKFNISVWSLLALGINSAEELRSNDVAIPNLFWFSLAGVLLLTYFYFTYRIQYSLECSKKRRKIIESILDRSNLDFVVAPQNWSLFKPGELWRFTFFYDWILIQFLITESLTFAFLIRVIS